MSLSKNLLNNGDYITNKKRLGMLLSGSEPESVGLGQVGSLWQDTFDIWREQDPDTLELIFWDDDRGLYIP